MCRTTKTPCICAVAPDQLQKFACFLDKNEKIIKSVKLEFKHNNSNVLKLVQFIELYDSDCKKKYNLCNISYAEYYYDNYGNLIQKISKISFCKIT